MALRHGLSGHSKISKSKFPSVLCVVECPQGPTMTRRRAKTLNENISSSFLSKFKAYRHTSGTSPLYAQSSKS